MDCNLPPRNYGCPASLHAKSRQLLITSLYSLSMLFFQDKHSGIFNLHRIRSEVRYLVLCNRWCVRLILKVQQKMVDLRLGELISWNDIRWESGPFAVGAQLGATDGLCLERGAKENLCDALYERDYNLIAVQRYQVQQTQNFATLLNQARIKSK